MSDPRDPTDPATEAMLQAEGMPPRDAPETAAGAGGGGGGDQGGGRYGAGAPASAFESGVAELGGDKTIALINYILLIASVPSFGVLALIGVVLAYVNRADAPTWLQTHYTFQIRTFWISVIAAVIGVITALIGIGIVILMVLGLWVIVRAAVGIGHLIKGRSYPNYRTWLI